MPRGSSERDRRHQNNLLCDQNKSSRAGSIQKATTKASLATERVAINDAFTVELPPFFPVLEERQISRTSSEAQRQQIRETVGRVGLLPLLEEVLVEPDEVG